VNFEGINTKRKESSMYEFHELANIFPLMSDREIDDSAEPRRLRRFAMTAYTGGQMDLAGWKHPVVVDLSGLEIASQTRPILKDHDGGQIVGHTDGLFVKSNRLNVTGVIGVRLSKD